MRLCCYVDALIVQQNTQRSVLSSLRWQHSPGTPSISGCRRSNGRHNGSSEVTATEARPGFNGHWYAVASGLDAARQIRCVSSDSIIAFLTEQNSPAVAKEALNIGARAYLVKSYCGSELLPALEAVLEGREFISKSLFGIP